MGRSPIPVLSNSKEVFGRVRSETIGFERERQDTPSFDHLPSCERGDAQESKFGFIDGLRCNEGLAENRDVGPVIKRAWGQLVDALHHTCRSGPLVHIFLK
jgi:hypothetical protein